MHDVVFITPHLNGGCPFYRCTVPSTALNNLGYDTYIQDYTKDLDKIQSKVVVIQRPHINVVKLIKTFQNRKSRVFIELDDDLLNLPPNHVSYTFWQLRLSSIIHSIKLADGITVTTHTLANIVKQYNQNVHILPNCIPQNLILSPNPSIKQPLIVGYGGAETHYDDLRILQQPLETLVRQINIQLLFCGIKKLPFRFSNISQVQYTPNVIKYLNNLIFDIGLIPLIDNQFNQSKSDIKFLEYSARGIPSVVSNVSTYPTCIHETNGFRATTDEDWIRYIKLLIEDLDTRKRILNNAHTFALNRTIERNIHLWIQAYQL